MALTSSHAFVTSHRLVGGDSPRDGDLYTADDIGAYLGLGSGSSAAASTADSKGTSAGSQASVADSKAISDSINISVALSTANAASGGSSSTADSKAVSAGSQATIADSKAVSDSVNCSIADSKAESVASALVVDVGASVADSKATSAGTRASVADSKAVSDSSNSSLADSKGTSAGSQASIADSKAVSVSVLTSTADSKAVSTATAKVAKSGDTMSGALVLTGGSVATNRRLGIGVSAIQTTGVTLDATSPGLQLWNPGAGQTATLPAANAVNAGEGFEFVNINGTNALTIARAGADTITSGSTTGQTSVTAALGARMSLRSDGVSIWYRNI